MTGGLVGLLIGLAPVLLLVGSLLLGRYPGERAIQRWRRALVLLASRAASAATPSTFAVPVPSTVRGGSLIGCSRAGRAPPEVSTRLEFRT